MKNTWKHKSILQLMSDNKDLAYNNPIEVIRHLSKELVLKAFSKGWQGPPYDIIELAKLHNFEIVPNDMVIDARILPLPRGRFRIEYNPFQNPRRISFSIAHEIGHTLFLDCAETVRYRSKEMETSSWELEFLCNIAAAEILLPYGVFSLDANSKPANLESLMELSNKYQASLESVFIRYCEVANKPCLILLASINDKGNLQVQYSIKSDASRLDLPEGFIIPEFSKAYDCKKPGWTSYEFEEWDGFNGQKFLVQAIGLAAIRKHQQPRVGIIVIPQSESVEAGQSLYIVKGDATEPRAGGNRIIAQVVNTSASVGFGFGKSMSKKYPYSRKALERRKEDKSSFVLGESQLVDLSENTYAFQMLAQKGIFGKNDEIPLKYSSLLKCLVDLRRCAVSINASVHMPMIGAGQAKGDWNIIKDMIYQELVKHNIDVTVYIIPSQPVEKNKNKVLTLFE